MEVSVLFLYVLRALHIFVWLGMSEISYYLCMKGRVQAKQWGPGKRHFLYEVFNFLHAEQGLLVLAMLIENWVFSSKEFVLMGIGSKVSEKIKVLNLSLIHI